MEKQFETASAEVRWYAKWDELGVFAPDADADPERKNYTITIPPPNVTGSLHMGHALCYTIQDILGRWRRMCGDNVLIQPGVDHGGISTQTVVEKEIAKEKLTRQELGREKFLLRVGQWKEQYGARIVNQMQRLGCAFDWSRERYTMDPAYSDAVIEHFIRLYDQELIYRGARVINWCPRCQTALSDIEVEYVERDTFLWNIRYPFADGNGEVVVATTRPETMLGDTAVAVNPEDPRYASMAGRMFALPLTEREIPLIFDNYASMEFGTGAVKVTPAHDLNDYEAGRRHNLPMIIVIGEDGRMTETAGQAYSGLTREEARESIERDLEEQGFLVKKEPYRHSVGTCERCHTIIEPLLSEQWFVKMAGTKMVNSAIDVVKSGEIEFIPERYTRIYIDWMENIRDWCISRQLWWGHRIPIYYAPDGKYAAAKSIEDAAAKLEVSADQLRQDEDVLDTWFSSDLWPFATLGWPENTPELKSNYPTDVLVTSREIIYLWVARMIMMGIEFTDQIPFKQVYIYATVLDSKGRRMSKSLSNGIDPIEMIDKYGADALRFSLVRLASKGQDIRFSEERIPEARNFCTKIWNAARFVEMSLEGSVISTEAEKSLFSSYSVPERWILTRLQQTITRVSTAYQSYDLDDACAGLYEFFWNDYCDWFVELAKPALRSEDTIEKGRVQFVLADVLDNALKLMHPIMPFLTEEIWSSMPKHGNTLLRAEFPASDPKLIDQAAAAQMDTIIASIRAIRNARAELKIAPSQLLSVSVLAEGELKTLIESNSGTLQSLAKINVPTFVDSPVTGEGSITLPIQPGLDLFLEVAGAFDSEKEKIRITSELATVDKDIALLNGKLSNPNFVERAAVEVVAKAKADLADRLDKKTKLEARLAELSKV